MIPPLIPPLEPRGEDRIEYAVIYSFLTGTHTSRRTTYHDIKVSVLVNFDDIKMCVLVIFVSDQKTKRCFIKINTIDHKIVYAYINDIAQI